MCSQEFSLSSITSGIVWHWRAWPPETGGKMPCEESEIVSCVVSALVSSLPPEAVGSVGRGAEVKYKFLGKNLNENLKMHYSLLPDLPIMG